jgi:lipopolysaccharide/colanic/teichoic acid biosynthesis glycosyltransferase
VGVLWLRDQDGPTTRLRAATYQLTRSEVDADRVDALRDSLLKRSCDTAVAVLMLVLLIPLMLFIALAIKIESPGPVIYRSRRVGLRGREFSMLKFRKMHRDASGPPLTAKDDERLTRVGSFLLRSKLDELPQLWNVIRGDMSLVGPRPEDPVFVALYPDEYRTVLAVRPGITGLSQLAFAKENLILDRPELAGSYEDRLLPAKIGIDSLYVFRHSLAMDARILLWTLAVTVARLDIAVDRESGTLSVRRRSECAGRVVEERAT